MDEEKFAQRVFNLDDGLDPLLPARHPHIGNSFTDRVVSSSLC